MHAQGDDRNGAALAVVTGIDDFLEVEVTTIPVRTSRAYYVSRICS
jgi:hypothetical protein